jgi:hypothetical protein
MILRHLEGSPNRGLLYGIFVHTSLIALLVDSGVKVNNVALKCTGNWVRVRYGDRFCESV